MGQIIIREQTIKNPITFIGESIGICYGSDTSNPDRNYRRGLQSIMDGHGRVLEFAVAEIIFKGYSARTMRQLYTHIGGNPTRVQESTRYIDYTKDLKYVIPDSIKNNKDSYVIKIYTDCVRTIKNTITELLNYDIPKEDAQMLLPLAMESSVVGQYNMRTLASMANQRMCNRAYWEYRNLMRDLKKALSEYSPEWKTLCDMLLVAKCEKEKVCYEKFSCGKYPKKED